MTCPRCNAEWDVSKSPCPRCGLLVHLPGRRTNIAPDRAMPPVQMPRIPQTPQDGTFTGQQSGGMKAMPASPTGKPTVGQPQNGSQSKPLPSVRRPENRPFPAKQNNPQMPTTPSYPLNMPPRRVEQEREREDFSPPSFPEQQPGNIDGMSSPAMQAIQNVAPPIDIPLEEYENNPFLARLRRDDTHMPGGSVQAAGDVGGDVPPTRSVPQRPQMPSQLNRSTESLSPDMQRPIRPSRLVTDALGREGQRRPVPPTPALQGASPFVSRDTSNLELVQLLPGTLLRGGRYRLSELLERQEWLEGVYEATWMAQDAQRGGSQVMIRELVTPDGKSMVMQSTLRKATMALTSVGRHAHIPTLWDAFSDQGRNFFVFEPIEGETLAQYMRRTGHALPEEDVIDCCLQMTEILEILLQQASPLVHGLIQPEHIVIGRTGSDYILTNFSIILAGGATQFVTGIDRSHLTPYTSPEFVRGAIDTRSDLYALVATAYHATTGSLPLASGISIPEAKRLNPMISSAFDSILARGLRATATQRYQRPSELRQDLLAMRSVNSTIDASKISRTEPELQKVEHPISIQAFPMTQTQAKDDGVATVLPSLLSSSLMEEQEQKLLLPRPEELSPMLERNDMQQAAFWLVGILICLVIIVMVSRGFM